MKDNIETTEESIKAKFGARVYLTSEDTLLIKQTIKSGPSTNADYVIDRQREKFVGLDEDAEIGKAIREALAGKL